MLQGDKNNSFLRAARAGDTEKVSRYLRSSSLDVNTSNEVRCRCRQLDSNSARRIETKLKENS